MGLKNQRILWWSLAMNMRPRRCSWFGYCTFFLCMIGTSLAISSGPVSFFGSSHVSVRLQEARSSSDIFFRLRTRRADSVLFLAAGRTDYCLLVLDAGRLKVHINLGAGETEIASEAPFLLNDMKWHSVNLTRRGSQLSLLVDNHLTKGTLPSRFHELNIHFGIWLGGLAGFSEIFLGNLPAFRGCLSDISYNQEDVLARAKTHLGQINGVTWNCSDEFDAGTHDPYSLMMPNSYVITRLVIPRQGTIVKMSIQPSSGESDGLIFYASGVSSRPDYVAVEFRQGRVRLIAEMGSGPVQVQSSLNISDNLWHPVMFQVSPYVLQLVVDNQTWISESSGRGSGSRHLDVSEFVYLGIEESKRTKVRALGLIDRSFRGCIKGFTVDEKAFGLPDADVSSNITTSCATNATTSIPTPTTMSKGNGSSLEVITISRDLIRIVTLTDVGELEIMRVTPLQVAEGDSTLITPRHLSITLDLSKFGIRESGVLFRINKASLQGRVEVATRTPGSSQGRSVETFSLLDVGAGRVRYWHNGQESSKDSIELSLKLVETPGFLLPSYLQDERVVSLPVEITEVNDPPEIRLVPGGVLRLAEGTKIRLTPDVITSLDPDTGPHSLLFSLISMGTIGEKKGYLELASEPGKPIRNFTQADLLANNVWYQDQGQQSSSKLALKVTDGSSVSQTAVLRVETFPLRIAPEVNTGIEVANVMGSTTVISSTNLSFTSNAGDQGLVVEYHVISGPKAGTLQLRRSNGQWTSTDHFTQLDLQAARLRYLLQRPSEVATEDEFTFHVSLAETKMPSEFRFRLKILSLRLDQMSSNSIYLNESTQGPLSLRYKTFPLSLPDSAITYVVVQAPKLGYLTYAPPQPLEPISVAQFSQADVLANKVIYSFKLVPFSPISDHFYFNVTTSHLELTLTSGPFRFDVQHTTRKKPQSTTIKPLIVVEGARELLSPKILRIRAPGDDGHSMFFNVTSGPNHGRLEKERETLRLSSLAAPSTIIADKFSSQDLERGRVSYIHDGSESPRDRILINAWNQDLNFMFACQMDIIVKGVNNHPPKKAPTASLSVNVVIGGKRSLSPQILDYIDHDWDAERAALKYTMKGNSGGGVGGKEGIIGNIYDSSKSPSRPIFQWTQTDIDARKLIFKHEGTETQGALHFWVTDGKFIVNGTLGINAGSPWIHVVNTSTLIAKKGSSAKLTEQSIIVDTNMDVDLSGVRIRITDGPNHGFVKVNGTSSSTFTLGQVASGLVMYENGDVTDVGHDGFVFEAVVDGSIPTPSGLEHFDISIYPEAYWTPLIAGANNSVVVNENSSAVISQTSLHIINPHIPPSDIVYTLTRPPSHGYLAIDPNHSNEESDDYVAMWDQTVINDGRLRYVQSEPNRTHDSMQFHVTNGVQTLRDLRLDFIVIPSTVHLSSSPIIINEGGSCILNFTNLHSSQSYFADKLAEVKVTVKPSHGTLGLAPRPEVQVQTFPYSAIQEGKITYTHDGSETSEDSFTVVAVAQLSEDAGGMTRRLSMPHIVRIQVLSTNDQVPIMVNNTGTWAWMGGSTPLTNSHLAATDPDSDETQLVFYVVGSRGGFLHLKEKPEEPLMNFTQAQINESLIVFTHKGHDLKPSSFDFEVSDGLNEAEKETFKISVRKPELSAYQGRVPLVVFPFTHSPIRPENLLVRSSDEREVYFQVSSPPSLGQIVLETGEGKYTSVLTFSQWNVSNGKVYYEHSRNNGKGGERLQDVIRLIATSKFADPLTNVTVDVDISVSGLQRYLENIKLPLTPLQVKEGGVRAITEENVNLTSILHYAGRVLPKGNIWRGGLPSLRLQVSDVPQHGWLLESDEHRLRPGAEILPSLLNTPSYLKYMHDDSETTSDQISFSLWLVTTGGANTTMEYSTDGGMESTTWLLNITLPILVTPVNDQSFNIILSKVPIAPVVQGHWRKLTRNDVLVSDPDTPPAHILYEVESVSHGRLILLSDNHSSPLGITTTTTTTSIGTTITNGNGGVIITSHEMDLLKEMSPAERFTQADIDGGRVIYYHSGPVIKTVSLGLQVSDGEHGPEPVTLNIPIQPLTLQALQSIPMRIQQGSNVQHLAIPNVPLHTNGDATKLLYNITRFPLHGKLLLKDRTTLFPVFSYSHLVQGEISYVQTDMSVTNDSFVLQASFNEAELYRVSTSWLVHVVAVPLLKRIKEVRSFVKGFAVGGIVAPDEGEFSVSHDIRTTVTLALLDASPLSSLTGVNPVYEIIFPPRQGSLHKVSPSPQHKGNMRYKRGALGRKAGRFTHEDIRRGAVVYVPEIMSNEIFPTRQNAQADEFIFKILAPGVQPAIGIAKFQIHSGYFDPDKGHTEIISDGSTDPATKRSGGGGRLRDVTFLVTPQLTRDSLAMIGIIIAGVMTLSLFLVVGIRCTCSKKGHRRQSPRRNNTNNGGLNNGDPNKTNGIGIIDAFSTTAMTDPCTSDSEAGLRPLMMSTLSPRSSRNKVSMSRTVTTGSESGGSWTSSMIRNDTPTPSLPQCRVTPLCPSGGGSDCGGPSLNITCPLLPPMPICDTFSALPEELDPPEPYGFSYANLPPPLEIPPLHEEETAFHTFSSTHQLINSNSSTMTRGTMTLPHSHSLHSATNSQGTNTPSSAHPSGSATLGGTLRKQTNKNQYWV